MNASTQECIT